MLLGVLLSAGLYSCRKDNPVPAPNPAGTFRLQFTTNAGGKAFHLDSVYDISNGRYKLNRFLFFIGYPRLVKNDGTEVPLADVLMVNFTTSDLNDPHRDKSTVDTAFSYTIPAGSYKAIRFGLGVPPQFNAGANFKPSKWPSYHALGIGWGEYWDMGPSAYRFVAINGQVDTSARHNGQLNYSIEYHILGVDSSNYKPIELTKGFTLDNSGTQIVTIPVDINRVFANGSNTLNFKTQNISSNANAQEKPAANIVLNNMETILKGQ